RNEVVEIRGRQSYDARRLGRTKARDGGRAEQEGDLAEVVAGDVVGNVLVATCNGFVNRDPSLEQRKERGCLPFEQEPFVATESHVRRSGGQRRSLVVRQ